MESYATEIVIRGINCRWVTCFWSALLNFMIKWWLVTCTTLVETTSVFGVIHEAYQREKHRNHMQGQLF